MDKILVVIGGGEIKNKTTLEIDRYVASLAKAHAGEKRATALFVGTASHDSMPYFNSFRKTYTSVFDIKAEVALSVHGEMDFEHIKHKFEIADAVYVGGGDTVFMLEKWKESGIEKLILQAYDQGKIIAGLSAGAICWFENMFTDYLLMRGESSEYVLKKGLGVIKGTMCPHFNEREDDFINATKTEKDFYAYALENDCALVFKNGELERKISSGGKAYVCTRDENGFNKVEIE